MNSKLFYNPDYINWQNVELIKAETFVCGFCGDKINSDRGYTAIAQPRNSTATLEAYIRICPGCKGPSLFTVSTNRRYPGNAPGRMVPNLPPDLGQLFDEARQCAAAGAYTASVLISRKMLMNIAVNKGATPGERFVGYVQYLSDKGYVPPDGESWVDYVRTRGNEATHEIALMAQADAIALLRFVEMLLRFIYEFPNLVPAPSPANPRS